MLGNLVYNFFVCCIIEKDHDNLYLQSGEATFYFHLNILITFRSWLDSHNKSFYSHMVYRDV